MEDSACFVPRTNRDSTGLCSSANTCRSQKHRKRKDSVLVRCSRCGDPRGAGRMLFARVVLQQCTRAKACRVVRNCGRTSHHRCRMTRFLLGHSCSLRFSWPTFWLGQLNLARTDGIQNITGNILTASQGKMLFVYTSAFMFCLRFCAGFIEKRIGLSPVGILLACAIIACIGLNLVSGIATFAGAIFALSVYALAKLSSGQRCWLLPQIASRAPVQLPSA